MKMVKRLYLLSICYTTVWAKKLVRQFYFSTELKKTIFLLGKN